MVFSKSFELISLKVIIPNKIWFWFRKFQGVVCVYENLEIFKKYKYCLNDVLAFPLWSVEHLNLEYSRFLRFLNLHFHLHFLVPTRDSCFKLDAEYSS